jgi:hypothetical protein
MDVQSSPTLNKYVDNKKRNNRLVIPTIRFNLELVKPSNGNFAEFNFNSLMVKALKISKKQLKTCNEKNDIKSSSENDKLSVKLVNDTTFSLLDYPFKIDKDEIKLLLNRYLDKIALGKQLKIYKEQDSISGSNNLESEEDQNTSNNSNDQETCNNTDLKKSTKNKKQINSDPNYFDSLKYKYKDFSHLGKGKFKQF